MIDKNLDEATMIDVLQSLLSEIKKYFLQESIEFASISINSWDILYSKDLQSIGFNYILTWVDGIFNNFNNIPQTDDKTEISTINIDEIDFFKEVASTNYFKGGRFYMDNNFENSSVDKMYANLISNSYKNNDIMLVYRLDNKPAGLFICKEIKPSEALMNLKIAPLRYLIILPEYRQKKIAWNLFIKIIQYLKGKCDFITTGLEIHNLPSFNLHSKIGFKFNYTHNVFHWWNKKTIKIL